MNRVVSFKLNKAGVKELLKSAGMQAECKKHADRILNSVSGVEGYVAEPRMYPERCGYAVLAREYPAIADNLKHNTLIKAAKV